MSDPSSDQLCVANVNSLDLSYVKNYNLYFLQNGYY